MEPSTTEAQEAAPIAGDPPRTISASSALSWWISALRLWRIAPVRLTIVCLLPLLVEFALQQVPKIGVALSKVAVPFFALGLLPVFHETWTTRRFRFAGLLWSFRSGNRRKALQLAVISASVFVVQMATAMAVHGAAAFDAVMFGRLGAHPELATRAFILTLILPGMIPGTLLLFAGALLVLGNRSAVAATAESIRVMLSSPAAFVITCAITAGLIGVALTWLYGALMIVIIPWATLMAYAAYRSAFLGDERAGRPAGSLRPAGDLERPRA